MNLSQPALFTHISPARMFALQPFYLPELDVTETQSPDQAPLFNLADCQYGWLRADTWTCPSCSKPGAYHVAGGICQEVNNYGYTVLRFFPQAHCPACGFNFAIILRPEDLDNYPFIQD